MAGDTLAPAKALPELHLPDGNKSVTVKVINSTTYMKTNNVARFWYPVIKGHEVSRSPSYSFLIEHTDNGKTRRLLFDLGLRTDWNNLSPFVLDRFTKGTWILQAEKDVADILTDEGMDLKDIEAIIWSHWHLDHSGNPSTFPPSTDLIVGPGFKKSLLPGWPKDPRGSILESDYNGRNLREIDFDGDGLTIGRFKAFDFFGDKSFFLLDAPGHTIGHLCALARTSTSPPSFLLMGADTCHHAGALRPSEYLPLPRKITPNPLNPRGGRRWPNGHTACPGAMFLDIHPKADATQPFYVLSIEEGAKNVAHDRAEAERTIEKIAELDAADNVFVCLAHDETLLDIIDFYPKEVDCWMEKGWAREAQWAFLADFQQAAEGDGDRKPGTFFA